VMKRNIDIMQK